jgi:hypothetical protein
MSRSTRCAWGVVFSVTALLGMTSGAWGAMIPAPNPMDVLCNGMKLGTLEITEYGEKTNADGTVGAGLVAKFVNADPMCPHNLRWIQSVVDGKGTIGQNDGKMPPYLDPYQRDDKLPWYWTEAENSGTDGTNGTNGPGSRFADFPSQDKNNNGNFIKFETALVCVDGLKISFLKGFTWGYKVNADMTSTVDPFAWLNAPTAGLTGPTTAWDGTMNNMGGGTPAGYMFSETCNCPCVPEPTTLLLAATTLLAAPRRGVAEHWLAA